MLGGVADALGRITDTIGSAAVSVILTDEEKRKREALRRGNSLLSGLGHFASVSGHPLVIMDATDITTS